MPAQRDTFKLGLTVIVFVVLFFGVLVFIAGNMRGGGERFIVRFPADRITAKLSRHDRNRVRGLLRGERRRFAHGSILGNRDILALTKRRYEFPLSRIIRNKMNSPLVALCRASLGCVSISRVVSADRWWDEGCERSTLAKPCATSFLRLSILI